MRSTRTKNQTTCSHVMTLPPAPSPALPLAEAVKNSRVDQARSRDPLVISCMCEYVVDVCVCVCVYVVGVSMRASICVFVRACVFL
mmetsp:Transcript_17654/g.38310  ORF Transcript_17654/g.38310 Transcript_17654/m.38310 type:complete len:86 (+) Transcript_17654:1643-1900(+)